MLAVTRNSIAAALLQTTFLPLAVSALAAQPHSAVQAKARSCDAGNGGITLPQGFCATIFADNIGHARHLVVAPNGVVYVNTWSGRYYGNDTPHAGGFLVALQDTKGDGHADVNVRFGSDTASGNAGGTGIALYHDGLYAETNDKIVRYSLPAGAIAPTAAPQTVISGLPLTGDHPMHPIAIDAQGHLYVDLGSATNSCQSQNRTLKSPGIQPCTELETRAGTWFYDANRTGQIFSPAERFVTGLRNGEGISFDSSGRIFATMHGRDQLRENWPESYTPPQGANEPAEELVELQRGSDYGWPYCYYGVEQKRLVLAPEYGGDGGKKIGVCATKREPIATFPAHWAPLSLQFYAGTQFPTAYRGGAFIAFHGSWNRAPFPQEGYNLVFQPLANGKPSGSYRVFADGFAGAEKDPGGAVHRPTGVAVGPDGALYVAEDQHGRIWRITYEGPATTPLESAPAPKNIVAAQASTALPPEGIHPNAGSDIAGMPIPQGATAADLALGSRVFHGQIADTTCTGCHGLNGEGTPLGPNLTNGKWLWGDGSVGSIKSIITNGVPQPKDFRSPMPPMGGAQLTPAQVTATAEYIWALNHRSHG